MSQKPISLISPEDSLLIRLKASHLAHSFRKNVVLPLLLQNKKDSNKRHYPFYMGRSGLEPPTSPLSGVRSNHLS